MTYDEHEHPELRPLAEAFRLAPDAKAKKRARAVLAQAMLVAGVEIYEYDVGDLENLHDHDAQRCRVELELPEPTVQMKFPVPPMRRPKPKR